MLTCFGTPAGSNWLEKLMGSDTRSLQAYLGDDRNIRKHGPLHGVGTDAVQGLLARLRRLT